MKKLILFLLPLFFLSCNSYYYAIIEEDTPIYVSQNDSETKTIIPANSYVFIDGKSKTYRKIKYNGYKGWAYNPRFQLASATGSSSTRHHKRSSDYSTPSSSKTVHVKGYYRKNGTYVKPHTRSAPRKRS